MKVQVLVDEAFKAGGDADGAILLRDDGRADKTMRVPLIHGDVVVWGGPARLRYHGISPLKKGSHPLVGEARINLTFRKAG